MKRLTQRDEYGNADIIGVDSADLQLNLGFEEFNLVTDALNRLAFYEDAHQNGRLVVLPCKVGDMVFRYSHVEQQMQTLKCEGFLYDGLRWKARCTDFVQSWVGNQKRHFYLSANSFGKTAFLTREEAEKAMKEET